MMDNAKLLIELNGHARRAQRVLAAYLPPDTRKSGQEVIAELLGILDSRELHRLQAQIAEKAALFS
jgi:hypothetical protein